MYAANLIYIEGNYSFQVYTYYVVCHTYTHARARTHAHTHTTVIKKLSYYVKLLVYYCIVEVAYN